MKTRLIETVWIQDNQPLDLLLEELLQLKDKMIADEQCDKYSRVSKVQEEILKETDEKALSKLKDAEQSILEEKHLGIYITGPFIRSVEEAVGYRLQNY